MAMRTLSELVWLVAVLTAMGAAFGVTGVDSDAVKIPTFTVQEDGWLSDTIATKFKAALMAHPRRLARSQADEADVEVVPGRTSDQIATLLLIKPVRPAGKFYLVDIRGLDLEGCCKCGGALRHRVHDAQYPEDYSVHKKNDHDGQECRRFRKLVTRTDVILMNIDLFNGALCCRNGCKKDCGLPESLKSVTYDDFEVGFGATFEGAVEAVTSRTYLATFRGGCHRGWWNSSTVRLDLKTSADALHDPSVIVECGGFEDDHAWKCCMNYDHDDGATGMSKGHRRKCTVVECAGKLSYTDLLTASQFGLAPRGNQRWSSRLIEVMAHDSIPVIISDGYTLPYEQVIDWDSMSLVVPEAEVSSTAGLQRVTAALKKRNAAQMLTVMRASYSRWFASSDSRIDALLLSAAVVGKKIPANRYDLYSASSGTTATQQGHAAPPADTVSKATAKLAATTQQTFTALKAKLEAYWHGKGVLEDSWVFPDAQVAGLDAWATKIARALQHGRPLTVGVIGSSVAVGHDNCAYDSFENQLQRTLEGGFAAVGVNFTVRNAGQGGGCGDSMYNQVWCLPSMVGDDVDFTTYSWSYFESGKHTPALANIHELFIRWSLMMPHAPIPTMLFATEHWSYENEDGFKDKIARYAKFGFNAIALAKGLLAHGLEKRPEWGALGDGMHTTTRYGESESAARKESLGVLYRNWHPGPLGFQVVADVLAWRYATAAIRAAEMLASGQQFDAEISPIPPASLGPAKCHEVDEHKEHPPPLMRPSFCVPDVLPSCINHELPTFGTPQIHLAASTDASNPMKSKTVAVQVRNNDNSTLIPQSERGLAKCMHADHCRGMRSRFMTYKLPPMAVGHIKVCCPRFTGEDCGAVLRRATYYLNTQQLSGVREDSPKKCAIVREEFLNGDVLGRDSGTYLSISWGDEIADAEIPYVSHVITL